MNATRPDRLRRYQSVLMLGLTLACSSVYIACSGADSLETTGPLLISALQQQDMYLAGSFLMFLSLLTVVGVLISDIALAWLDPRIRLSGGVRK